MNSMELEADISHLTEKFFIFIEEISLVPTTGRHWQSLVPILSQLIAAQTLIHHHSGLKLPCKCSGYC
jgi:hypothetical protein